MQFLKRDCHKFIRFEYIESVLTTAGPSYGNSRLQGPECFELSTYSMKAADCSVTPSSLLLGWTSSHELGESNYASLNSRDGSEADQFVACRLNGNDVQLTGIQVMKTQNEVEPTQVG